MINMDIQLGEYVRTPEQGFIGKLVEINRHVTNYYRIDVDREIHRLDGHSDHYIYSRDGFGLKHSFNIIDLIEDEDIIILEYKSPKWKKRILRKFEVSKIDEFIKFENLHCDFMCKIGDKKITDDICKNIKIREILTHEQYENNCYRLEE